LLLNYIQTTENASTVELIQFIFTLSLTEQKTVSNHILNFPHRFIIWRKTLENGKSLKILAIWVWFRYFRISLKKDQHISMLRQSY